jgi:hypothetical protein
VARTKELFVFGSAGSPGNTLVVCYLTVVVDMNGGQLQGRNAK